MASEESIMRLVDKNLRKFVFGSRGSEVVHTIKKGACDLWISEKWSILFHWSSIGRVIFILQRILQDKQWPTEPEWRSEYNWRILCCRSLWHPSSDRTCLTIRSVLLKMLPLLYWWSSLWMKLPVIPKVIYPTVWTLKSTCIFYRVRK